MDRSLLTIIRAFQAEVQRGLATFRHYKGCDDLLSWRSRGLPMSGYLDPKQRHEYYIHGIGVCLQLGPERHIDWDFGYDGRMDGFDLWRLQKFAKERPELEESLSHATLESIFEAAISDGSIVTIGQTELDTLYYVAEDL